jgi:peptide-methionine (R)-S-oxide reductase
MNTPTLFKYPAFKIIFGVFVLSFVFFSCQAQQKKKADKTEFKVNKTEQEWKQQLSREQFNVLRLAGTELPGTGKYNLHFEDGIYTCAGCGAKLFSSESKFETDCGWPSFDKALGDSTVIERRDLSHGMIRTEILCSNCGGHLGHVFNDGPTSTGLRYCINSVSLDFDGKGKANPKEN